MLQENLDLVAALGDGAVRPYAGAGLVFTDLELDTRDDAVRATLTQTFGANLFAGATLGAFGRPGAALDRRLSAVSVMGGLRVGF